MAKPGRIFITALIIVIFLPIIAVKADGSNNDGDLWVNFSANATPQTPELKMATSTAPGSQTTIINYKIFGYRKIPIICNDIEFTQIEITDCGFTSTPGNPKLPVKTIFLEFPENYNYNVRISALKRSTIENIAIVPSQPAPPENSEPVFKINQQIYQNSSYYPSGRILDVKVVNLRERRLLEIRLTPVRFNPLQREVDFAYEIDLMVTFMAGARD